MSTQLAMGLACGFHFFCCGVSQQSISFYDNYLYIKERLVLSKPTSIVYDRPLKVIVERNHSDTLSRLAVIYIRNELHL